MACHPDWSQCPAADTGGPSVMRVLFDHGTPGTLARHVLRLQALAEPPENDTGRGKGPPVGAVPECLKKRYYQARNHPEVTLIVRCDFVPQL